MTLKELIDKLNKVPKYYGIEAEKEAVTDACVVEANDRDYAEYPPGTVLFQCRETNLKSKFTEDSVHILTIYPQQISNPQ